ncbi:MAG TPA: glycerol-3-phosphate dehydrogenase [Burkholderiales bacterium]|nr:glycerol-3-phosphate dehydrogenase [Burkholderiales bacterium]
MAQDTIDLLIIGGGINGAGIARDAAGRGLSVLLCEQGDLGSATSSASSKLIHGGLRYLENYAFRLVAEALAEREILLKSAPHLISPLNFVLPRAKGMRPAWMLRLGLWLYDHLGGTGMLSASRAVDLRQSDYGGALKAEFKKGFVYTDCRVDDARLVIANVRGAEDLGARLLPRARCASAKRNGQFWEAIIERGGESIEVKAKAVVNASGPWVHSLFNDVIQQKAKHNIRLVKGSHIVVPRLYQRDHAYLLQNYDQRVVLAIPFQEKFTLIGTTDISYQGDPAAVAASDSEVEYLCEAVNRYIAGRIYPSEVVWRYSGVRALYDDGHPNPSDVSRDYKLIVETDDKGRLPLLSVYGGKITTYRKLAEAALKSLAPWFTAMKSPWTAQQPLPGGEIPNYDFQRFLVDLVNSYPKLPPVFLRGIALRHGSLARDVLQDARDVSDLGENFGAELFGREVDYFIEREWARTAEDILWRRSKAGLFLGKAEKQALERYVFNKIAAAGLR